MTVHASAQDVGSLVCTLIPYIRGRWMMLGTGPRHNSVIGANAFLRDMSDAATTLDGVCCRDVVECRRLVRLLTP